MAKRISILIGLVFVGVLIWAYVTGDTEQEAPPEKKPTTRDWQGNAVRPFNITYNQRGQRMTVREARFRNLKQKRSRVTVLLEVPMTAKGGRPAWVKPATFVGLQPVSDRRFVPTLRALKDGALWNVELTFKDVPTRAFGPTCANKGASSSDDPFAIFFKGYPGAPLSLLINAPAAPAGHCLASEKMPEKAVYLRRIRTNDAGWVSVNGAVTGPAKRVTLTIRRLNKKGGYKTTAKPAVSKGEFAARFRVPTGRYEVSSSYGGTKVSKVFQVRVAGKKAKGKKKPGRKKQKKR